MPPLTVCHQNTNVYLLVKKNPQTISDKNLQYQFGLSSSYKLMDLLKDTQVWGNTYNRSLQEVFEQYEQCKRFSRTSPWSKVAWFFLPNTSMTLCVGTWNTGWIVTFYIL